MLRFTSRRTSEHDNERLMEKVPAFDPYGTYEAVSLVKSPPAPHTLDTVHGSDKTDKMTGQESMDSVIMPLVSDN